MYPEQKMIRRAKKAKWNYLVRWSDEWQGVCNYSKESVTINPLKSIVSVIIHENLHMAHPKWTEKHVLRAEEARRRSLTEAEAWAILKEAFPKLYKPLRRLYG